MDIKTIIEKAGGLSAVARKCGISRQAVFQWKVVPVAHVAQVAKITGLSRRMIRPDVY